MIKARSRCCMLLAPLFLAAGCGTIPDAVVEAARDSAKEAIEKQVDEIMAELADELLGAVDFSSLLAGETQSE